MLKKVLIGGAVVVGGYYLYKWFIKPSLTSSTTSSITSLPAAEMEKAAWLAQKFNPGFDVGGLQGAFGASPVLRVIY